MEKTVKTHKFILGKLGSGRKTSIIAEMVLAFEKAKTQKGV